MVVELNSYVPISQDEADLIVIGVEACRPTSDIAASGYKPGVKLCY
jgi:hypothetical protein